MKQESGTPVITCCSVPVPAEQAQSECRECGQKARPVMRLTMESLLKAPELPRLADHSYYFCATPACTTVYFSIAANSYFYKSDLRVRVGVKETEDPVPVCYCFGFTEKMVLDEIHEEGYSTIPDKIRIGVKAGNCACEVMNPSGKCCLGAVTRVVLKGLDGQKRRPKVKELQPVRAPADGFAT